MNIKFKTTIITTTITVLTAVTNAQQTTLLTAEVYDILVLEGGELKELKDGNYGSGRIGIGQNASAKIKDTAVFNGELYAHSSASYNADAGFGPIASINLLGYDSEMAQASNDALGYASYLDTLSSTASYGDYDGSSGNDGQFSFSSSQSVTVLDFDKLEMDGTDFLLTGRSGSDDKFIIRMSKDISFDQSDVVLTNLDHRDVVWYNTGSKDFDLHHSASTFSGTILSPNGRAVIGDVAFTGAVIGTDLKFGTGADFTGQSSLNLVPEPSSSLLLLSGLSGLMLVRRRKR
jgi:hypothetical protein